MCIYIYIYIKNVYIYIHGTLRYVVELELAWLRIVLVLYWQHS